MKDMSIVLGTYNRKDLLFKCIQSAQLASKGLDIEIIINDAGSTDGTIEILKRWEKHERFKIIYSKKKSSPTQAYNECFKIARGKYIIWLSDDLFVKDKSIVKMFDFMETQDRKTLGAFYMKNASQENMIKFLHIQENNLASATDVLVKKEIQARIDRIKSSLGFSIPKFKNLLCPSVGCIRRDFLEELGWWNVDYLFYGQDVDLNFRIIRAGGKILACKDTKLIHHMQSDDLRKHNVTRGSGSGNGDKFQLIAQRFGKRSSDIYPKILFKFDNKYDSKKFNTLIYRIERLFKNANLYFFGKNKDVPDHVKEVDKVSKDFDLILDIKDNIEIVFPQNLEISIKVFANKKILGRAK